MKNIKNLTKDLFNRIFTQDNMSSKQLKDIKLLRCNGGNVKDILIECDKIIHDIGSKNRDSNSNNVINENITNENITNDNNNNEMTKQDNENITNENKLKVPFVLSIQYNNIENMESVIWSTANTMMKKYTINSDDNNNDILTDDTLPDFTHDVEINQIQKINELVQWRTELMKNCISSSNS